MKKASLSVVLAFCLAFSVCGCTSEPTASSSEDEASSEESVEDSGAIMVDENLLTVDVTLPASYFEDTIDEEIIEGADAEGFQDVVIHDSGKVTYTMSKAKHREILDGLKAETDKLIDETLSGPDAVASFASIEYNSHMSEFTVEVDSSQYGLFDSLYALTFYVTGMYYQAFDGVPPEDNHVIVYFIDAESGEVIETADSVNMK